MKCTWCHKEIEGNDHEKNEIGGVQAVLCDDKCFNERRNFLKEMGVF